MSPLYAWARKFMHPALHHKIIHRMPAGYSGTPLLKKLGIKAGYSLLLLHPPEHYLELLGELPENCQVLDKATSQSADFVHLFCTSQEELAIWSTVAKDTIKKTGMLWVSWPKGKSNISTDLKRDPIREHFLQLGLVDVKVAAVDDDWSGLKFVYRVKDRD